MNHQPYQASKFAASLRRQLFRKHLGLLPDQDYTRPDANFMPINKDPNLYDWGSPADKLVSDPLSREFANLWNGTAETNTEVFSKAFHCVPADNVRDWKQYQSFFQDLFVSPSKKDDKELIPPKYQYGHVVKEEFPGGVNELKDWLDRVRGTLVNMSLLFMDGEDFAEEGLKLNALTDEVYTWLDDMMIDTVMVVMRFMARPVHGFMIDNEYTMDFRWCSVFVWQEWVPAVSFYFLIMSINNVPRLLGLGKSSKYQKFENTYHNPKQRELFVAWLYAKQ